MLRLFEVGARAARGVVVMWSGMERSRFLAGKSEVESISGMEMEEGIVNLGRFCVKDTVSGFGRSYFEAQRLFPCSEE